MKHLKRLGVGLLFFVAVVAFFAIVAAGVAAIEWLWMRPNATYVVVAILLLVGAYWVGKDLTENEMTKPGETSAPIPIEKRSI